MAASKYIGALIGSSAIARAVARAPKISTGTASGSTSSASSTPPRCRPSVSPAPTAPIRLRATLPTSSAPSIPGIAAYGAPSAVATSGAASTSGRPVSSQCTQHLASSSHASGNPETASCSSEPS